MRRNFLRTLCVGAVLLSGCMGMEMQVAEQPRAAAVRSGLDLMAQLALATKLDLSNGDVRSSVAGRLGLDSNTTASDLLVAIQIAVGAEDPRAPKLPSSLNMSFRIAYAFGNVALGVNPIVAPVFVGTPVTVAPTADALHTFLKRAATYFGAEALSDADRTLLVTALIEAANGRTPREAWAAAFAAVAITPGADTL